MKQRQVDGLVLDADSQTFGRRAFKGPPNFQFYTGCHDVWTITLIGLEASSWGLQARYHRKLRMYMARHPNTYALL